MDALLEEACWAGDAAEVARLLAAGAEVHANEDAALRVACAEGHVDVVELLLNAGADVNARDEEALCAACAGGFVHVMERLLTAGANVNPAGNARRFDTPLARACRAGHLEVVERLLRAGVDVNANDGVALASACAEDNLAIVDQLLAAGAVVDISMQSLQSVLILMQACLKGHPAIVERLLRSSSSRSSAGGGRVRPEDLDGPLNFACDGGSLEVVEVLIAAGADPTINDGMALALAARKDHQPIVDRLVAAGANLLTTLRNEANRHAYYGEVFESYPISPALLNGDPAAVYPDPVDRLQYACAAGALGAVESALRAGADVHADDDTALRLACWAGHLSVVERLLNAGADVSACSENALEQACGNGHLTIVDRLLVAGANVQGGLEDTAPLLLACQRGQLAVVTRLLAAGADVHVLNNSALFWAACNGDMALLEALLAAGADVQAQAFVAAAASRGHASVVRRLLQAGASADLEAISVAVSGHHLEVLDMLLEVGGTWARTVDETVVIAALAKGHSDAAKRLLRAGYEGSARFWREARKAGIAPHLVLVVPLSSIAALPPPVQLIWLRYHVRIKRRLHHSLQRARVRLDRSPQTYEP